MKVFMSHSGHLEQPGTPLEGEAPSQTEKRALLVYCGKFLSLDGEVEVTDEHLERLASNHNSLVQKLKRMAQGDVPLKHAPPVQLDHSTSARDTVGRLVGDLEIAPHQLEDGTQVRALFGNLRILGRENVERVMDGRWTHLSIGADLEEGKISELTITPFPAAAEASMLSKMAKFKHVRSVNYKNHTIQIHKTESGAYFFVVGTHEGDEVHSEGRALTMGKEFVDIMSEDLMGNKMSKGASMLEKLKAFLMGTKKLSAEKAEDEVKKMSEDEQKKLAEEADAHEKKMAEEKDKLRKHLMDHEKMSEKDADEKLAKMSDEEKKELAAKCAEEEAKMAADESDEAKTQMSAALKEITKLSTDLRKDIGTARLAERKLQIRSRLQKVISKGKMTPAEYKKLDITKMAQASSETVDAVFKSYEDREPVIMAGLLGSTKAVSLAQVKADARLKSMEKEMLEGMPFLSHVKKNQTKLGGESTIVDRVRLQEDGEKEVNVHIDATPHEHYEMAMRMIDEGKLQEAKELIKKCMESAPAPSVEMAEDAEKETTSLADGVKSMEDKLEKLMEMVGKLAGMVPGHQE